MSGIKKRARSARLIHRLTLQSPQLSDNGSGGYDRTWQNVATVWAEIVPLRSNNVRQELYEHGQIQSRVSHEITMRYRADVRADMRMVYDGRFFNIRHVVNEGERGQYLRVFAEEGVAD